MTFILLGFLFLYMLNNKKIRIVLCCFLPALLVLPAFFKTDSMEMTAFYAGLILICASPLAEKLISKIKLPEHNAGSAVQGTEDDILDNKKKWRLIVAGYIIFILFAVFACAAIFTLNSKLNSLYKCTQNLQQQVEEMTEDGGK